MPNAPKTAARTSTPAGDKPTSRLQKINSRALKLQKNIEKMFAEVDGYVGAMSDEERASKTGAVLKQAHQELVKMGLSAAEVPKHLFRLHELKWEPSIRAANAYKPGDLVGLKGRHVERFTKNGAYKANDISRLRVVSVHGTQAKVQIADSKEALGLVPTSWLTVARAA